MDSNDLPPPAYSLQAEFDQKTSTALQASLTIAQPSYTEENEEWEQWDEALFEAANNASAASGSSSRIVPAPSSVYRDEKRNPAVAPLRIHKRNQSLSKSQRNTEETSSSSGTCSAGSSSSSTDHAQSQVQAGSAETESATQYAAYANGGDEEEDRSIPPPPFTPVGPSLDGPPFEQVVLSYVPDRDDSQPPSPLISPVVAPAQLPSRSNTPVPAPNSAPAPASTPAPVVQESQSYHRRSLPYIPQSHAPRPSPRPLTYSPSMKPLQPPAIPRVDFNSSVAYNKRSELIEQRGNQYPAQSVNAAAFYKSVFVPLPSHSC